MASTIESYMTPLDSDKRYLRFTHPCFGIVIVPTLRACDNFALRARLQEGKAKRFM